MSGHIFDPEAIVLNIPRILFATRVVWKIGRHSAGEEKHL